MRGVILETPFLSICQVATSFFAGRLIDMFENYNRIRAITCPVYIVHGTSDSVVPFEQYVVVHLDLYIIFYNNFLFN